MEKLLGLELTKIGDSDDIMEGTNVTLLCRTGKDDTESSLEWFQVNGEFGKSDRLLNSATDLPNGKTNGHRLLKNLYKLSFLLSLIS